MLMRVVNFDLRPQTFVRQVPSGSREWAESCNAAFDRQLKKSKTILQNEIRLRTISWHRIKLSQPITKAAKTKEPIVVGLFHTYDYVEVLVSSS